MSQNTSTDERSILRGILIAVLILIAIPFIMMIAMMPMMGAWGMGHMNGWMWNGTGASWAWAFMWLVMLGIFVGGGFLVYRAIRTSGESSDPALEELRVAYARGELSDEEFETRRERLQER